MSHISIKPKASSPLNTYSKYRQAPYGPSSQFATKRCVRSFYPAFLYMQKEACFINFFVCRHDDIIICLIVFVNSLNTVTGAVDLEY